MASWRCCRLAAAVHQSLRRRRHVRGQFLDHDQFDAADVDSIGGIALPVTIHAGEFLIQASGTLSIYLSPTPVPDHRHHHCRSTTLDGQTVDILTINGTLTATIGGTKILSLSANGALLIAPGEIGIAGIST